MSPLCSKPSNGFPSYSGVKSKPLRRLRPCMSWPLCHTSATSSLVSLWSSYSLHFPLCSRSMGLLAASPKFQSRSCFWMLLYPLFLLPEVLFLTPSLTSFRRVQMQPQGSPPWAIYLKLQLPVLPALLFFFKHSTYYHLLYHILLYL